MRKLISVLLTLTMVIGLFGCLGVAAMADGDDITFLVTSAAGVESNGEYDEVASVLSAYSETSNYAMLVSVDTGSDISAMAEAGYSLAYGDPYSLGNKLTGIYPDGSGYEDDGTGWRAISVGDDLTGVYFVAVGGNNDEEVLASFRDEETGVDAGDIVIAIGPWSAADTVALASGVDMFWTVVDSGDLASLQANGYMLGDSSQGTLVVNAGTTAETVAVVSIANGRISTEYLADSNSDTGETEDTENTSNTEDTEDTEDTDNTEDTETAGTITLEIDGYDSISWTKGGEDKPSVTCSDAVESISLYLNGELLQTLTEGANYTLTNDGLTITFDTNWLDSLFDLDGVSDGMTLTVTPAYAEEADDETGDDAEEEEEGTPTITLGDETATSLSWDAGSSDGLTITLGAGSTLDTVRVDGAELTEGTDYSYDAGTLTLTIYNSYLSELAAGEHTIVLSAADSNSGIMLVDDNDSGTVTLSLTVTAATTTTALTASAEWTLGGTKDLVITLESAVAVSTGTLDNNYKLQECSDFSVDGVTLTFSTTFLDKQDVGTHTIVLTDTAGNTVTVTLTVTEASASISVTSTTASWTLSGTGNLTITLGEGSTLATVSMDGNELADDTIYTYDSSTQKLTFSYSYLNNLSEGTHTITLTDEDGATATVTLTVTAAATATAAPTATPSYTYTWNRGSGASLTIDLGKSVSKIDIYSGSTFYREATQGTDYTLSGTSITFSASMVNNSDGTAFWSDGTYHLVVTFTDSATQDIYLTLTGGTTSSTESTAAATATASAAPSTSASPNTGDTTRIGLYVVILIVLVIALAVIIIIVMKGKKQSQPERWDAPSAAPEDGGEEDYDVSDIDDEFGDIDDTDGDGSNE